MTHSPSPPETFHARLVESSSPTDRVRFMTFEREDGRPFHFRAGQWLNFHFPLKDQKGHPLKRAYSIASPPRATPRFELAITHVDAGPGSEYLHAMKPGDTLEARGPQGTFVRPLDAPAPALFVATGTGLAPFRSMVHDAIAAGRREPLWVLFGVRTPRDILWEAELRALEKSHPFFRLEVTLSRPPPEWSGRTGHVQEHVRALWGELSALGPPPDAWICGVKKMLLEVRDIFRKELGLERARVHTESYG
ncbi:MAG: FAD-dependent oxidoreductase [Myxococcota bacterium]